MRSTLLLLVVASLLCGLTSACARDEKVGDRRVRSNPLANDERQARRQNRIIEQLTAEELYASAREALDSGDAAGALELYDDVEARFPFTPYATQAQLDSIYAHYRLQQSELALSAANRFLKQYPQHARVDYVQYLKGLVNFSRSVDEFDKLLRIDGTRRDPMFARSAFEDFSLLIKRFPDSRYAQDARRRMVWLRNGLARYELHVAEFYVRRGAPIAASRRAQYIIDHYQGTDSVPAALDILQQSYAQLGLQEQADQAQRVLQANYPDYVRGRGSKGLPYLGWVEDPIAKLLE
ncbi:MAG TPA: outer membrane protein assembly factor BamD [Nevskiales bacterium]|nr:outer membrane protein assembly factor BamD [Nevskiales bacterium]